MSDPCELTKQIGPKEWSQWLREPFEDEEALTQRLRTCTHTGRPAGGASFMDRLEGLVGRVLRAKKIGRPRKGAE